MTLRAQRGGGHPAGPRPSLVLSIPWVSVVLLAPDQALTRAVALPPCPSHLSPKHLQLAGRAARVPSSQPRVRPRGPGPRAAALRLACGCCSENLTLPHGCPCGRKPGLRVCVVCCAHAHTHMRAILICCHHNCPRPPEEAQHACCHFSLPGCGPRVQAALRLGTSDPAG